MAKPETKKKRDLSWHKVGIWQAAQVACLMLFLLLIYRAEQSLIAALTSDEMLSTLATVELFLAEEQLVFLPGKMWRLFVPITCVCLSLLLLGRWRWYFLGLVGLLCSVLLVGDRIYYQFFSALLSLHSFSAVHQVWAVKSSVFSELQVYDFLLFLIWPLFGVFGFFLNKQVSFGLRKSPRMFAVDKIMGILLCFLAMHCGINAFQVPLSQLARLNQDGKGPNTGLEHRFAPAYITSSGDFAVHFGLYNFHMKDIVEQLNRSFSKRELSSEELDAARQVLGWSKAANDEPSPLFGIARDRNVIVVSMEAFQHYLLGLRDGEQEIIPNLNQLREGALEWDYCLDNVTRGGTSDAEFSILTGLLPDIRKIVAMSMPRNPAPLSLPGSLKAAGYHTASLHGYKRSFWNRHINHPTLGIDQMLFEDSYSFVRTGLGASDEDFFTQSVPMLEAMPSPFFAFMISLSSHHPYNYLPGDAQLLDVDLPASMARDYLRACHYADQAFGDFQRALTEVGVWQNSLIVIYGDHVAPMDEGNKTLMKQRYGIDPMEIRERRVPLLMLVPGRENEIMAVKDSYRGVVGGLQDVYPTVMHLLGKEVPFGVYGAHLLNPTGSRPSVPFVRWQNGFVKHGALFEPAAQKPVEDDQGPLFQPGSFPEGINVPLWYRQAGMAMYVHQLIFDLDAQSKAAEAEASKE